MGIAVIAAMPGSSGIWAANPDISRYVVAPIRHACWLSSASSMKARYSGPAMPQRPGQPSAAPYPSREMMKSTIRLDIGSPSAGVSSLPLILAVTLAARGVSWG